MGPRTRARTIINYLATNEVAGTPSYIHHQLELFRDIDFSVHTTRRRLKDFHAAGYLDYLDDRGNGFYVINDTGREKAKRGFTDQELDDIRNTANHPSID